MLFGLSADRWLLLYVEIPRCDARSGFPGPDPVLWSSPSQGPDGWLWQSRLLVHWCVCYRQTCWVALTLSDVVLAADGVLELEDAVDLAVM